MSQVRRKKFTWLTMVGPALAYLWLLAACNRPAVQPAASLTLRLEQSGLYRLTAADVQPFGWDLARLQPADLRLAVGEQPLPFWLAANDGQRQLVFYGQVTPTRYANHAIYTLSLNAAASPALAERQAAPVDAAPGQGDGALQQVRLEPSLVYLAQVREGDPWLGPRLFAPAETAFLLPLAAQPAAGAAALTVRVWAATSGPGDPDHHLEYHLNGVKIGADRWDGDGAHEALLQPETALLKEGANELLIRAPGDTEARADLVYVDWVELRYPALVTASEGRAAFSGQEGAYSVPGFAASAIEIWDVTDAVQPVRLTGAATTRTGAGFTAAFAAEPGSPRQYVLSTLDALLKPSALAPTPPSFASSLQPATGADYIVISDASLAAAVAPLTAYHSDQGLRTAIVTTDAIYHHFSSDLPDPAALTAFLRWAAETWPKPAPRFVLLAGDASYDPLGHLAGPHRDLVPTGLVATLEMGETASDNKLADLDGDGLPDLAVGRLPAQTAAEMQAMVAKTLAYARSAPAGEWQQRALFVADDDDSFFANFGQEMNDLLPPDRQGTQLVIQPGQDMRAALAGALNQGVGLLSYMGHGAIDIWAQEEILRADDIPALKQQGQLPVVVVWACLSGYFHHPASTSLGETLILDSNGGAVAALVPTGQTFPFDQHVMAKALFGDSLFTQPTLGEALLAAFRELNPANPGELDIIHTFVLLGDPALRLVGGVGGR